MFYRGMTGTLEEGLIVEEEQAFDYALERCLSGTQEDRKEFREMLVEWFYSGNWIEEDEDAQKL